MSVVDESVSDTVEEWLLDFHGSTYLITLTTNSRLMSVEVEDDSSGDRWSAEFSSTYIEEITQKAGNYKRFGVFATMVSSAFSKNSESVFVDLLTLSDLEMLKARKAASNSSTGANSGNMSVASRSSGMRGAAGQHKRYLILTYTGEFDRVHYPLPLAFEDVPNAPALQRTIRRLRVKLAEKAEAEAAPASDREREMRTIVAQLRQDNTELRHRLRQGGHSGSSGNNRRSIDNGAVPLSPSDPAPSSPSGAALTAAHSNAELVKENQKLRHTVDTLKTQLKQQANLTEALKTQHAKEMARLRQRSLGGVSVVDPQAGREREKQEQQDAMIQEFRRKIMYLERELRLERLAKGVPTRTTANTHTKLGRSASPLLNNNREQQSSSSSALRQRPRPGATTPFVNNNYSPSSSLGRRFDPTAYVSSRRSQSAPTTARRTLSGTQRYRYDSPGGESGYSSAGSTRSKQSIRSGRSDRSSSNGSASAAGKCKKKASSAGGSSNKGSTKKKTASSAAAAAVIRTPPPPPRSHNQHQHHQAQQLSSTSSTTNSATMTRRHYRGVTVDGAPAAAPRAITNQGHGHGPRKVEDADDYDDDGGQENNKRWNVKSVPPAPVAAGAVLSKEVLRQSDASLLSAASSSSSRRNKASSSAASTAVHERSRERSRERENLPPSSSAAAYGIGKGGGGSSGVSLGSSIQGAGMSEVSEIDRRIAALQSYLDKARAGIVTSTGGESA